MATYRDRNPQIVKAEIDYLQGEIDKVIMQLEKLENKMNYLQDELRFNLKKIERDGE